MREKKRPSVLGLVFLTVLVDMIGFSVIFPLFPAMLEYYFALEGHASLIGRVIGLLSTWGPGSEFTVVALFGGLLGSIYSVAQFIFAPLWGIISDRIGRRAALLITLTGTMGSYVLWFVSGSFILFVVARLVGGIMAGNVSTASAAVADTCEGPDRAKGMGILGAGIGLGFVIGPAVGGATASWNLLQVWPGGAQFGINPFSGCALIAFVLAAINLLWAAFRFPETLSAEHRERAAEAHDGRTWNPLGALKRLDFPGLRPANLSYFFYFLSFASMEFTLPFLAVDRLGYAPRDNAWMFVFVGLIIVLVQGGLVRRMAPRFGEKRLVITGMALTVPGFVLIGIAHSSLLLYLGLASLSVGSALVMPCLSALVSRYTPADRQGFSLGVYRSLGSLSRAVGPLVGGLLYWALGSWAPYLLGALALLLPLAMALALPPVPRQEPGSLPVEVV